MRSRQAKLSRLNLPSRDMRRRGPRTMSQVSTSPGGPCSAAWGRMADRLAPVAQTRKKRRRKHRGTQAGTIERAGRTGSPQTREEAKQISRERRRERLDRPPTLKGAAQRAAIAA